MRRKECPECLNTYDATDQFFHRDAMMPDGLTKPCANCRRRYAREHYRKNRERILAASHARRVERTRIFERSEAWTSR